ncbi:isopenicillin N synthase family dioxygenase [Subtercola sp. RTI3]|uniref:isopenicillin N synthase family dioxygenase n=1 Tax=Subtercola sp. RTI3 TaxID=3048639 RepID=UPI002B23A8FF|nr:2-oxoglutarate and iron-dependent oxygenase domain-containing protein [Subtercola sp. RTI3]MEA9985834.1 2-oxoglutarate and iron-dependent oxygenase domain-containing protein [Subtercola sp. RTI3]
MSAEFSVPTVDIGPYVTAGSTAERAQVAAALDAACREVGFIQIVGHGVDPAVIAGLAGAMDDFFALTLAEKKQYVLPPSKNRGYSPPKSESLSYSIGVDSVTRMNDFFEAFNVGASAADYPGAGLSTDDYAENVWPEVAGYETRVSTYYDEASRVAQTLIRIFEDALKVEPGYLEALTDHSIDVMRMNNYALPEGEIELGAELTGMGEHTDFGIVTVLWADQVDGLQVLDSDGQWHDVSPADDAFLINLGDVAARLTNDQWASTLHRVKPPIVNGTIKRRRSAAFFHDGNADAIVGPLPHFVPEGEEPHYEPVTVKEHIVAKLSGSRAGKKNVGGLREAARLNAAAQ